MSGRYRVAEKSRRTIDGIVFHSMAEARRYTELKMLERVGSVTDIELQPEYLLHAGIKYRADFRYKLNGKEIVEDVKGHKTAVYKLKRKLLLADYPDIDFREVQ